MNSLPQIAQINQILSQTTNHAYNPATMHYTLVSLERCCFGTLFLWNIVTLECCCFGSSCREQGTKHHWQLRPHSLLPSGANVCFSDSHPRTIEISPRQQTDHQASRNTLEPESSVS